MNMKFMIVSILLLSSGLRAQEAGSVEFLHETTTNPLEVAVSTMSTWFKKPVKKSAKVSFAGLKTSLRNAATSMATKKVRVIATGTIFFAICALIKHFEKPVLVDSEDDDAETTNEITDAQEAPKTEQRWFSRS